MPDDEREFRNAAFLMRVRDRLQQALEACAALHAADPESSRGLSNYRLFTAGTIYRAADAYVVLRSAGADDASRMLIRPGLEAAYRLNALRLNEEIFFRIAYTEFLEEKKWIESSHRRRGVNKSKEIEASWSSFKMEYHQRLPAHPLTEQKLSVRDAAVLADYESHYETHYRLYCTYTHAAFKAATGDLSIFYKQDTQTVSFCVLSALWALLYTGVQIPELPSLWEEFTDIQKP